jgi:hypothetical protein
MYRRWWNAAGCPDVWVWSCVELIPRAFPRTDHNELTKSETEMPNRFAILIRGSARIEGAAFDFLVLR